MFESLQQRSKALGLKNTGKNTLTESSSYSSDPLIMLSSSGSSKKSPSPTKMVNPSTLRHFPQSLPQKSSYHVSSESKENVDVAFEINITTGPNVNVSFNFFPNIVHIFESMQPK